MRLLRRFAFAIVGTGLLAGSSLPAAAPAAAAASDTSSWYSGLSLQVPTGFSLIICHGFNCHTRTPVALGAGDRATLANMVRGATPEAERKGIARAVAWFDKRVGKQTGTTRAKAYARGLAGDTSQYDCVDRATNTTSLFVVLEQWGLLKHHEVDTPESRRFVPIIEGPHSTAVLAERKSRKRWAIDSWTHNYGELPDVMPIEIWLAKSDRAGS